MAQAMKISEIEKLSDEGIKKKHDELVRVTDVGARFWWGEYLRRQ